MQIELTGRHVDITDPIRTHIEKKLQKIRSYFNHIIDVRVVLSVEKYRQFAEITISANNGVHFHSHEATNDMYASIDKAVEKLERQLRRRDAKVRATKRRKGPETPAAEEPAETAEGDEEPVEPQESYEQYGEHRVFVSDKFPPKPMSVEEAVMQLGVAGEEFLAFVNARTDDVNVVFKRKEGGFGLLRRSF
ncbi:ribosome-associated translation inhibitor RaiA [Candidatus Poribacteria bacterium]|nr:ribosome-associated translation inhibitor RaiA [Candidatus Poribacteria bacterium]